MGNTTNDLAEKAALVSANVPHRRFFALCLVCGVRDETVTAPKPGARTLCAVCRKGGK